MKVGTIQRHRKQRRRHRKEGDELPGADLTQAVEHRGYAVHAYLLKEPHRTYTRSITP